MPGSRYVLFFVLLVTGLAADLLTKAFIFEPHLHSEELLESDVSHWWIDGVFGIQTSFNGGALFGMFQGGSFWLACLSFVALCGILVWLFVFKMAHSKFLTTALGMISGGILGNLYDRMGLGYDESHGVERMCHVRDWIHFRLQGVPFFDPWPNFNIADCLLVCGAIMLFFFALLVPDPTGTANAKEPNESKSDS